MLQSITVIRLALVLIELVTATLAFAPTVERTIVILYNKPAGVVTTHASQDEKGRQNVYDDVQSMRGFVTQDTDARSSSNVNKPISFHNVVKTKLKIHSIGRLDADTTGLLLLTNDGGLVHHVTNKQASTNNIEPVSKTYQATIMGYHDYGSPILQQMRDKGVDIGEKYGGWTLPVEHLDVLNHPTAKSTVVEITIIEGKNRQVRRMFHAIGSGVMQLKRVRIGKGLMLGSLQEGQWRLLSDAEIEHHLKWKPRSLQASATAANMQQQQQQHEQNKSQNKTKRRRRRRD